MIPFRRHNSIVYDEIICLVRIYVFCPKGKIDNTHLNIYGGKVVAGIAMEAVAKVVPALAPYVRQHDPEVHAAD